MGITNASYGELNAGSKTSEFEDLREVGGGNLTTGPKAVVGAQKSDAPDAPDVPDDSSPAVGGQGENAIVNGAGTQAPTSQAMCRFGRLVRDEQRNAYVIVQGQGNPTLLKVGTPQLNALIGENMRKLGQRPTKALLADFNEQLRAEAEFAGELVQVSRRVAQKADGTVIIALHDALGTQIWISPGQVRTVANGSDVLFYQSSTALAMVMPAEVGDWKLLKKYLNFDDVSLLMFAAWVTYTLAHAKVPGNVFVILLLVGGMGTGKSWISKVALSLVDPSVIGVQRVPKNAQDLAIASQNSQASAYDNIRALVGDISDAFCTSATRGAVTGRKLYSDDDLQVLTLHGALILNSIFNVADQPDLAQRCLPFRLAPIDESKRAAEDTLLKEFEADLPIIQRGLFDLIAQVLLHLPRAKVVRPQRMLGFVRWLAAMELAHGVPCPAYQDAYGDLLQESQLDALRETVLGSAVIDFAKSLPDGRWSGTPSALLAALNVMTGNGQKRPPQGWPENEISLTRRLLPLQAALMTQGVSVQTKRGKERQIVVESTVSR